MTNPDPEHPRRSEGRRRMSVYIDEDGNAVSRSAISRSAEPCKDRATKLADELEAVPGDLVERLFAEIEHGDDEHRAWLFGALKTSPTIQSLTAERDAALARVAELEEGLRKFAVIEADDGDDFSTMPGQAIIRCEIVASDLHQARALLEGLKP